MSIWKLGVAIASSGLFLFSAPAIAACDAGNQAELFSCINNADPVSEEIALTADIGLSASIPPINSAQVYINSGGGFRKIVSAGQQVKAGNGRLILDGNHAFYGGWDIQQGEVDLLSAGGFGGDGEIHLHGGVVVAIANLTLNNVLYFEGGTIAAYQGYTLRLNSSFQAAPGATVKLNGPAPFTGPIQYGGVLNVAAVTGANLVLASGSLSDVSGALCANITSKLATTTVASGAQLLPPGNCVIADLRGAGQVQSPGNALTVNAGDFSGVINATTLTKNGSGLVKLSGTLTVSTINVVDGEARLLTAAPNVQVNGGTLSGTNIGGDVVVTTGILHPGNDGANTTMTVHNLMLDTFSGVEFYANSPSDFNRILATGAVDINNALLFAYAPGANPLQTFPFITAGTRVPRPADFRFLTEGQYLQAGPFSVRVSYVAGDGNDISLTTSGPPEAPAIGTATPGVGSATVTFTPGGNNGSPIQDYTVSCGASQETGGGSPLTVGGLASGVPTTCSVTARNGYGNSPSSASVPVTPVGVPAAPTIGTATPIANGAVVTFTPPANIGGTAILDYRATCGAASVVGATSPITVAALPGGVATSCVVTARNAVGTGAASAPAAVTPLRVAVTGTSPTGSGTITAEVSGGGPTCAFAGAPAFIPVSAVPTPPPARVTFAHGLFDFTTSGCVAGSTITVTITYPDPIRAGSQYYKFGPTLATPAPHWYSIPSNVTGNVVTFNITDGGLGDDDLAANGVVVDAGGIGLLPLLPAVGDTVPTLSEWMLMLLATLMLLGGGAAMRRRGS